MAAIFILVTLATISLYLFTISTGQLLATTQDEQATRAYQAARTGIDWGAYQLLRNSGVGFGATCTGGGGAASQTLALGVMGGPTGATTAYFAEIVCTRVGNEVEAGMPVTVYLLKVTGCNRPTCSPAPGTPVPIYAGTADPLYVERQLQLTVSLN